MDDLNLDTETNPPVLENNYVTTDIPDPEKVKAATAAKRMFFVILSFIFVLLGILVWEIVDHIVLGR